LSHDGKSKGRSKAARSRATRKPRAARFSSISRTF